MPASIYRPTTRPQRRNGGIRHQIKRDLIIVISRGYLFGQSKYIPRCKRFDALNSWVRGCVSPSYTSLYYASARYISASKAVVAGEVGGGRARKRGGGPERSISRISWATQEVMSAVKVIYLFLRRSRWCTLQLGFQDTRSASD